MTHIIFYPIKIEKQDVLELNGFSIYYGDDYRLKEVDGGTEIHLSKQCYDDVLNDKWEPEEDILFVSRGQNESLLQWLD